MQERLEKDVALQRNVTQKMAYVYSIQLYEFFKLTHWKLFYYAFREWNVWTQNVFKYIPAFTPELS